MGFEPWILITIFLAFVLVAVALCIMLKDIVKIAKMQDSLRESQLKLITRMDLLEQNFVYTTELVDSINQLVNARYEYVHRDDDIFRKATEACRDKFGNPKYF